MTSKYKYLLPNQIKPHHKENYWISVDGSPQESIALSKSREVATSEKILSGVLSRKGAERTLSKSARVNEPTGGTLPKGIQFYRMWFQYLKLALELEQMGKKVELVQEQHVYMKNTTTIPQSILNQIGFSASGAGKSQVFRDKLTYRLKVKTSAYKGWDLDEVLNTPFNTWWKTHAYLFEGHYPKIISPNEINPKDTNFLYIRVDPSSKRKDVIEFVNEKLSERLSPKGNPNYKIDGIPRIDQLQNRYNALILKLKNWSAEEIANGKGTKIYIRGDEDRYGGRTPLKFPVNKKSGKILYSQVISRLVREGVFHVLDVAQGRFGSVLKDKRKR